MTDVRDEWTPPAVALTWQRFLAVCMALLVALSASSSGQTLPADTSPLALAARALNTGHYDEVEKLLSAAADERSIVLRARAHLARGRAAEAEKPRAGRGAATPAGDAALELGQLQLYLGRRAEGARTLQMVLTRGSEGTPADLMRLGLAARAPGGLPDANGFFRAASARAPDDPVINTAWGDLFLEKYNRADAVKSYQAALQAAGDYVPAQIGLARATIEGNPPAARSAIEAALKINPNY